jgi:O-Antigen ligase
VSTSLDCGGESAPRLSWSHRLVRAECRVTTASQDGPHFYTLVAFLVGLAQPVTISFVGQIPVSELILSLVLVYFVIALVAKRALPVRLPSHKALIIVVICQAVSLAAYVVSDLWWQSLPYDMFRGWFRMGFLLLDTVAFAVLLGAGNRPFVALQIGLAFSSILTFLEGPLFGDYWKFCFAYPATAILLMIAPRLLGQAATVVTSVGIGVLHLFMGYRSLGLQCLLLALLVLMIWVPRVGRRYLLLIVVPLAFAGTVWMSRMLLEDTWTAAERSNVERSAMMQAAWEGFLASPLIGNGSWFSRSEVWDNFLLIRSEKERETGQGLGFRSDDFEGIAIHSQILTTLAEGGIFGSLFFIVYALLLVCAFWFLLTDFPWHWLMPIRLSILISGLCSLMMSPFSGTGRIDIAMALGLALVLLDERRTFRLRQGVFRYPAESSRAAMLPRTRLSPAR